jgi:hypothetical protein
MFIKKKVEKIFANAESPERNGFGNVAVEFF